MGGPWKEGAGATREPILSNWKFVLQTTSPTNYLIGRNLKFENFRFICKGRSVSRVKILGLKQNVVPKSVSHFIVNSKSYDLKNMSTIFKLNLTLKKNVWTYVEQKRKKSLSVQEKVF